MLQLNSEKWQDRRRYRGLNRAVASLASVHCGQAGRVILRAGALVSVTHVSGGSAAWITTLAETDRDFNLAPIDGNPGGCDGPDHVAFDASELVTLAANRGTDLARAKYLRIFDDASQPGERYITRITADTQLFVISPVAADFMTKGGGGSLAVSVSYPDAQPSEDNLPRPLGKICDEWRVSSGTAKAYEVKKGQFIQIIDVEGQQCSDFMAMRSSALDAGVERHIDSTVSRTMSRSAYPLPGLHDKFYDQDIRPLLSVRQDTVGRHDTFALACTARGYEERGFPGHLNCSDNISAAFEPFGIQSRRAWPAINFFFNSWIDWAQHHITSDEAWSRPGDFVALRAMTDLVCVSTACPDDVDPINGWNPTDIHVRIYEEDTTISHSVSWRAQPEDAQQMTARSAFHSRTSQLTSSFQVARDLWMPTHYEGSGAIGEYWACKTAATLQDMSGLRKFDVIGPDATELLQHCMTRNIQKIAQHRGAYALMCDARGSVLDDGTLFRLEDHAFRWFCGSENSAVHLREQAKQLDLRVNVQPLGRQMPNLAIQGPKSREILREVVFTQPHRPSLDNLKWFGFTIARLHDRDGPMFMLCRSGFTGELGYEIFCDRKDALVIWDALLAAGAPEGLIPMGGVALNMLRIEAGLMIAGAEFGPEADAMEAGLEFAVDFKKPDFIGRTALERNATAVRRQLVGLAFAGQEAPLHGDAVFAGREQVGVITSGTASPQLGHAIAMARVAIENADIGNELEVGKLDGHMKRLPAQVVSLPFIDPRREKARA